MHCTCCEPHNVAGTYKRIFSFSAGVAHSRQTRQTRERSNHPNIYEHAMIKKCKSSKKMDYRRQRKRLSDVGRGIATCKWDDWGRCRLLVTMGLRRCREPLKFEILSVQAREDKSACNTKRKMVLLMDLRAQQSPEKCG